MKFLKHGFTIDEFKFSSLVGSLYLILITVIISYLRGGDISGDQLVNLAEVLIYVIAGVNVAGLATKFKPNKLEAKQDTYTESDTDHSKDVKNKETSNKAVLEKEK